MTTLFNRKKAGLATFKDKRGGVKKFKYTFHERQMVKKHINSFPMDESHYNHPNLRKRFDSGSEY